jgi:hypothetical protein
MRKVIKITKQLLFFLIFLLCRSATSQSIMKLSDSPSPILNHAFATQVGSGIYKVGERTAYIYRVSTSVPFYSPHDGRWSLRLRLPLTFGFFNFELRDVIDIGFPDKLATLSLVPALECVIPVALNWWIEPYVGFGGGRDFSTQTSSYIYATGIRSFALFMWRDFDIRLGNRLVYSGYTSTAIEFVDDFGVFESGLDFRRLFHYRIAGYDLDWSIFAINTIYLISPHLVNINPQPLDLQTAWEVGFTLGTHQTLRLFGVRMPRIGVSYRWSTTANAIRFIIGNPFPIDSPRDSGPGIL